MINIIKADIYSLFKNKTFYICLIFILIFSAAMPFIYKMAQSEMEKLSQEDKETMSQFVSSNNGYNGMSIGMSTSGIMEKPNTNTTWFIAQLFTGNILIFIAAVFCSKFIAKEFIYGTIKNTVSKGFSRTKIYMSKLIVIALAIIIFTIFMVIVGGISATITYGFGEITSQIIQSCIGMIGVQMILHICAACIFTMISMITQTGITSIVINMAIIMIGESIMKLLTFLVGNQITFSKYWLPTNIYEMGAIGVSNGDIIRCLLCGIIYAVITTTIGIYVFKKRDIK